MNDGTVKNEGLFEELSIRMGVVSRESRRCIGVDGKKELIQCLL